MFWVKVFKNRLSKIFYRLSFTNFTWYILEYLDPFYLISNCFKVHQQFQSTPTVIIDGVHSFHATEKNWEEILVKLYFSSTDLRCVKYSWIQGFSDPYFLVYRQNLRKPVFWYILSRVGQMYEQQVNQSFHNFPYGKFLNYWVRQFQSLWSIW